MHRVHELERQAGPEGRREYRRHRRRPVLFRRAQRTVQGHQTARFGRARQHGRGAGRHVPQRRCAARVRTAHRTRGDAPQHRRTHGRLRRAHRAHALRRHRRRHGRRHRRRRRARGVHRRRGPHRLEHPARHRPRRAVDDDRTRRVQTVPEPLQAHHHHIPRRIALCDRQPVRTRRRRQTQTQRPAQPVRFQIQACLRLPPSDRQKSHARRNRHTPRTQHVRELPVLVHPAHEPRIQSRHLRTLQPRTVRNRHRIHRLREHLLSGETRARAHQVAPQQRHPHDLLPMRLVRRRPGARIRQPLQLPGRGELPGGH